MLYGGLLFKLYFHVGFFWNSHLSSYTWADICSIFVSSFPYFVISVYFTGTFLHSINFEREEGDLPQILTRRFKKNILITIFGSWKGYIACTYDKANHNVSKVFFLLILQAQLQCYVKRSWPCFLSTPVYKITFRCV